MLASNDSREVWEYLSEGGAVVTRERAEDGSYRVSISKYNPLSNPHGALRIAGFLARSVGDPSPSVVVAWENVEDAVLAFAVGAELGVPVVRAFDMEGLVQHSGTLPAAPRGVLVMDAVRDDKAIDALRALLAKMGGVLTGVLSVVDIGQAVTDLPVNSLVSASDGPVAEHEGA